MDGAQKLLASEVAVVLPNEDEYISRAKGRLDRPVPEDYARSCLRCYETLVHRFPGMAQYKCLEDIPKGRICDEEVPREGSATRKRARHMLEDDVRTD